MSGRVKSQAELEQEKRDEELARQLAMEDEQHYRQQQVVAQQQQLQQQPVDRTRAAFQLTCPSCLAINNISDASRGQDHACGACGRVISGLTSAAAQPGWAGPMSGPLGPQQSARPAAPAQVASNARGITCQNCRCINQIPAGSGATQFMCGGCGRLLSFNQPVAAPPPHPTQVPPPSVPIGGPSSGTTPIGSDSMLLQGQPLQGQPVGRPVQVRCFQCQTVNAVTQIPGQPIQFMCGSCRAVNRV